MQFVHSGRLKILLSVLLGIISIEVFNQFAKNPASDPAESWAVNIPAPMPLLSADAQPTMSKLICKMINEF